MGLWYPGIDISNCAVSSFCNFDSLMVKISNVKPIILRKHLRVSICLTMEWILTWYTENDLDGSKLEFTNSSGV